MQITSKVTKKDTKIKLLNIGVVFDNPEQFIEKEIKLSEEILTQSVQRRHMRCSGSLQYC